MIDRGAIFAAARHALGLWRWFAQPDAAQSEPIACAAAALPAAEQASPLLGAALGIHGWLDRGGARPPLRAALALYWLRHGLLRLPCPLLTGAKALGGETPWEIEPSTVHFLAALAEEAEAGTELLRLLEREWFAARSAIRGPGPVAGFVRCRRGRHHGGGTRRVRDLARRPPRHRGQERSGAARRVRCARHRDRGDASLETPALRVETFGAATRRSRSSPPSDARCGRGRPPRGATGPIVTAEYSDAHSADPLLADRAALSPLERQDFDFIDLDRWMREADQAIRRAKVVLDQFAVPARPAPAEPDRS